MSRPRRAFGVDRPGRLPATRLKILVAELSDPQRLARARTYAVDGSVLDIAVEQLVATATVLGSRPDPYLVELSVDRGHGPPGRGEVAAQCTCPDGDLPWTGGGWCKHSLAALLVLADEVAIEPDLLARWRGAAAAAVSPAPIASSEPHPLETRLHVPQGVEMATIPDLEPLAPTPLGDPELDRWVTTAMSILTARGAHVT